MSLITRPLYEDGIRYAKCQRCGMGWIEHEQPVEILGRMTSSGETAHTCPEPFPREYAEVLCSSLVASGMPTTQRIKARIKLGLNQ